MTAQRITEALQGRWYGRYGLAMCPAHGNVNTPALSLSDGADGKLLARCHAGCDFTDILDALKALGLVEGRSDWTPPDPAEMAQRRKQANADAARKAGSAKRLWDSGQPITGTLAETYLRGRAITCPLPDSLRFHPACLHPFGQTLPAMLARVDGAERFAIHRTFLGERGKAGVTPNKMALGATGGGAVRLSDGGERLVVAEGIETGLSLLCGLLSGPASVWAGLGSGMKSITLPAVPGKLTIASDGGKPGERLANALAFRADALGWQVSILPAPIDRDWNDILQGGVAA